MFLLGAMVLLSGCTTLSPWWSPAGPPSGRPNILFILTDDLRYDALGASGNDVVRTPHIDRLAEQGMQLNRFYAASPVCHPSRASFLTGLYPHQPGVRSQRMGYRISRGTPTAASLLNESGYVTGFVGKAHPHGDPYEWGFDRVPAHTEKNTGWNRNVREEGRVFHVFDRFIPGGVRKVVRGNTTKFLVDKSIQFVRDQRDEPWFLWLATNSPHTPYRYSENHPYDLAPDHVPPGYPPDPPRQPIQPDSRAATRHVEDLDGSDQAQAWLEGVWARYYSEISALDEQLGRLLQTLDEIDPSRETLVILTSDNGIMHGSHGILFKAIWYEEAVRVPAIVRWPGVVEPGTESTSLVSSVDFLPFLRDAAGVSRTLDVEGRSFMPVLRDPEQTIRSHVFSESHRQKRHGGGSWSMIRGNRFKYVEFQNRKEPYLFDLVGDPHEQSNRAGDPLYGTVQEKLKTALDRWRTRTQ